MRDWHGISYAAVQDVQTRDALAQVDDFLAQLSPAIGRLGRGETPDSAIGFIPSDHGLLTGLGDNDHPQYLLAANFNTLGDARWQPLDATLTALAALDAVAGLVEQTGADAFTKRLIGVAGATSIPTRADADARYASIAEAFVTIGNTTGLSGERALAATAPITLTDGGAGAAATLALANTAVTPAAYGSATQVGTFTVDAQGRLTAAANVTISGAAPGAHTHPFTDITPVATDRLLGRDTVGSGAAEEISLSTGLEFTGSASIRLVDTITAGGPTGNTTTVPVITWDAKGRLTAVTTASIAFPDYSATYQPLDSDLTAIAALTTTAFGRGFLDLADAAAARTKLALGTMATETAANYLTTAAAAAGYQPLDGDLTSIAALATTSYGRGFLPLADAAAGRNYLGASAGVWPVTFGGTGAATFTAGRILFGAGTSAIATDADLFWDDASDFLGVNIAAPLYNLHVHGASSTAANNVATGSIASFADTTSGYGLYVRAHSSAGISGSTFATQLFQIGGNAFEIYGDGTLTLGGGNTAAFSVAAALNTSIPDLTLNKNLNMPTTASDAIGTIQQNGERLLHSYTPATAISNGGLYNLFIGNAAGNFSISDPEADASDGWGNTGIGSSALTSITLGLGNVAIGGNALFFLTEGDANLALGSGSMQSMVTGSNNVGLGFAALTNATTQSENVALGANALSNAGIGDRNIGVGFQAGARATGDYNLVIDAIDRSTAAREQRESIIVGRMSPSLASQTLRFNAAVTISESINIVTDANGEVVVDVDGDVVLSL